MVVVRPELEWWFVDGWGVGEEEVDAYAVKNEER